MSLKKHRCAIKIITYIFCIIGFIVAVFPLVWTLLSALKPSQEMFAYPPTILPSRFTLENFVNAWNKAGFERYFYNSIFVTGVVVIGQVFFSAMAAFAFARIPFKGRTICFLCFLSSMMVPAIVIMIPQFIILRMFNWLDTYMALIIPSLFGNAFSVFFLRQFFMAIPDSLQEAAEIDGCGYIRMFIQVFLPLCKHALFTLVLIRAVAVWNDFLWPVIVTNRDELRTVPVAIATVFFNYRNVDWAGLTSATCIALVPLVVVFLFARDYIIESIAVTGFK
ncbi:carbohydrate ABC transporter permease [Robinsoniella peoriensis]